MSLYKNYLELTKPGITKMVLFTGFLGAYLATKNDPQWLKIASATLGVALASASASCFNNYFDKKIDTLMPRTQKRVLPQKKVMPSHALILGFILGILSFAVLYFQNNLFAAQLATAAIFLYAVCYTYLKRKTPLATEIGAVAGALPPLIGYTGMTGTIDLKALSLFLIMFLWQDPHFWALSLKFKKDYRKAKIPVLSTVWPLKKIQFITFVYLIALMVASVWPYFLEMGKELYLWGVGISGAVYFVLFFKSLKSKTEFNRVLFLYSIFYLCFIFALLLI
jgi:protoheme IX farnesyltransferase